MYDIVMLLVLYYVYNEVKWRESVLGRLASGAALALVSDAGMLMVNDLGVDLVVRVVVMGVRVFFVLGLSVVLVVIVGVGLLMDEFTFIGFSSSKFS